MKLIVGLGNPGKEYEKTRHNVGFRVVEKLAKELGVEFKTDGKLKSRIAKLRTDSLPAGRQGPAILQLPQTYMNLSGEAVRAAAAFYKIPTKNIIIAHDEMDFEPGRISFLEKGSAGGHKGVASVQESLGTNKVSRCRIGIGRPASWLKSEDFVLQKFLSTEEKVVEEAVYKAAKALLDWLSEGLTKTMNSWNGV